MTIDTDLANWNKENDWIHLEPAFRDAQFIDDAVLHSNGENEENSVANATVNLNPKDQSEGNQPAEEHAVNNRKRMRLEEETSVTLCVGSGQMRKNKQNVEPSGKDASVFGEFSFKKSSLVQESRSVAICIQTAVVQTKSNQFATVNVRPPKQKVVPKCRQTGRRVVLGELLNYTLSPLGKQCTEEADDKDDFCWSRLENIPV